MALSLSISTSYGVAAVYHTVTNVNYSVGNGFTVFVSSYLTSADKTAGHSPLKTKIYNFTAVQVDITMALLPQIYTKLQALTEFTGATVVADV